MAGVAFCYLDTSVLGGAVQPNANGLTWYMVNVFRDTVTNRKDVVSGVPTDTLDSDILAQIGVKIANSAKARGAELGYAVSTVILPQSVFISV